MVEEEEPAESRWDSQTTQAGPSLSLQPRVFGSQRFSLPRLDRTRVVL